MKRYLREKYGMLPEIGLGLLVNAVFLLFFYLIPPPPPVPETVEISVDVVDFRPPEPLEIPPPPPEVTEVLTASAGASTAVTPGGLDAAAEQTLPELSIPAPAVQSAVELNRQIEDILYEMTFYGAASPSDKAGAAGKRPAGLRTGVSFDARRDAGRRSHSLQRFGGNAASEGAVERALGWLAKNQNRNGSWGSNASYSTGDVAALTSIALLAFLAHGETFDSPLYPDAVRNAANWLCEIAAAPGIESAGRGFGHAMLTYALAEAYAATGSFSIRKIVEERVNAILERQNKLGSFSPGYDNTPQAIPPDPASENPATRELVLGEPVCDLSLLGWHIQALVAARNAGIMPEKISPALQAASTALVNIHQAAGGGFSQGINVKRFPDNPNLTPVGLLALQLLNTGNSRSAQEAQKLLQTVEPPRWDSGGAFPLYRWYYHTQALFQAEGGNGRRWNLWNDNLKQQLLGRQHADGSWPLPPGDRSFLLQEEKDLQLYSTAMCTLMLEVYYRYLPTYSIAESDNIKSESIDELDMTVAGLLAPLAGGRDPMADLILGGGAFDIAPVRFGRFNGIPATPADESVPEEFPVFTTLASSLPVRKSKDWPQLLQPKQRIALFCDDLLPENFKGHLRLTMAVLADGELYQDALEVLINGKRVHCAVLVPGANLLELLIPSLYMQPFGNIVQIRNIGESPVAFDAAELGAFTAPGPPLFLGAAQFADIPPALQRCFNLSAVTLKTGTSAEQLKAATVAARLARVPLLFQIDASLPESDFEWLLQNCRGNEFYWEFAGPDEAVRQRCDKLRRTIPGAIPVATRPLNSNASWLSTLQHRLTPEGYDPAAPLWGRLAATGVDVLGRNGLKYYMNLTGKQVADWIQTGGSSVIFTDILTGGRFLDSLLQTEQPAAAALAQFSKLFEGSPRRLPLAFYPRYGEKPQWEVSAAAACNSPDTATIVIAKEFATPSETELLTLVPWSGPTEVIQEKGTLPNNSAFTGLGTLLQTKRFTVTVENNVFRLSGIWPELTVLRLRRQGGMALAERPAPGPGKTAPIRTDMTRCRVAPPYSPAPEVRHSLRTADNHAAASGLKASVHVIPATESGSQYRFKPEESESVEVTLQLDRNTAVSADGVFLATASGPDMTQALTFNVYVRAYSGRTAKTAAEVPMRFAFSGRCFQTVVTSGSWQSVTVPLAADLPAPYWSHIRILMPEFAAMSDVTTISYELNGISVLLGKDSGGGAHAG